MGCCDGNGFSETIRTDCYRFNEGDGRSNVKIVEELDRKLLRNIADSFTCIFVGFIWFLTA